MCPALQKSTPGPSADPRFSTIHLAVPEASACRQTIAQLLDIYSTMFYVSLFDLHTRNALAPKASMCCTTRGYHPCKALGCRQRRTYLPDVVHSSEGHQSMKQEVQAGPDRPSLP